MADAMFTSQQEAKREAILSRFVYHTPTHEQGVLLAECHNKIMACAEFLVDRLQDGRDRAVALTALEDVRMKMNKAIIFSLPILPLDEPAPAAAPLDDRPEYTG